jgi:hypothetical protein
MTRDTFLLVLSLIWLAALLLGCAYLFLVE